MARRTENELDAIRATAAGPRAADLATGSLISPAMAFDAESAKPAIGAVAEAIRAASIVSGPSIATFSEIAGRIVGSSSLTEADLADIAGLYAVPEATVSAAAKQFAEIVGLTSVEHFARQDTLELASVAMRPTLVSVAQQMAHLFADQNERTREQAKGLQSLLSPFSDAEIQAAAKSTMWPLLGTVDFSSGWPKSTRVPAFVPPHRDAGDLDNEHEQVIRESGLHVPSADGLLLLDDEPGRRSRGRPLGSGRRPLTELLDWLAVALLELTSNQSERYRIAAGTLAAEAAMHRDTLYDNLRFHRLDWPTTRYLLALYADPVARNGRSWPELIRHVRTLRE